MWAEFDALKKRTSTAAQDLEEKKVIFKHRIAKSKQENTALSQQNTTLSQQNTILSQKDTFLSRGLSNLRTTWSALSASKYSLGLEHSTVQTLYAQTHRQTLNLRKSLVYVQALSAHNAQQATLLSNALRNADSKLAALEQENTHLRKSTAAQTTALTGGDIEAAALRMRDLAAVCV